MAGIGFELKKLFKEESYTKRMKAYLYSAVVAAGPWLATVISLNFLSMFAKTYFSDILQRNLFMGTIIYSFIFSMIITVPFQFLITRYISDCLYKKEYKNLGASFIGLNKIILFITGLIGFIFYLNKPLPLYYKFFSIVLFMVISSIWILMVYLSTLKNFKIIIVSFFTGCLISIVLGYILMNIPIKFYVYLYPTNLLLAFLVGMIVTLTMLLINFIKTFELNLYHQYDFLKYFKFYKKIFFIGMFYTIGVWIHNFIIWFSEIGMVVYETYRFAPIYDSAVFLAYLTIIPSLTLFIVNVETNFYMKYKNYYGSIIKNASLDKINDAKKQMQKSLYSEMFYILEIQLIITIALVVLSKIIFEYYNFPIIYRGIFQIAALGAFCNVFLLLTIMVLLYFDARTFAFFSASLFLIGNSFWTLYFLSKGLNFYGFGYFIGSLIAFVFAFLFLSICFKNLTYYTFFSQPLFVKKRVSRFEKVINYITYYRFKFRKKVEFVTSYKYLIVVVILLIGAIFVLRDSELYKKYRADRETFKSGQKNANIEKTMGFEGREENRF
ncbi:MAG: hypothetical protein FXF47_05885 [Candidatus Mcinerneyibacterium aminivorans]|uniref:Exopolysaccharide Pel transporter PelG n=1 Tax=Candidatus Mcinerneyibacterium aminivorans TaxID=2703815 RepID=A0A5D0MGR2_9BACT|nr:MAG: hypothetical protein FXF47_05885 [Candidatus Mcinerneyibacterium aminivorans]